MFKIKHRIGSDLFGFFEVSVFDETLHVEDVNHALIFSHLANFWRKTTRIDALASLSMRENGLLRLLRGQRIDDRFFRRLPIEFRASNDLLRPVYGPGEPRFLLVPGGESIFVVLGGRSFELGRELVVSELERYGDAVAAVTTGRHERAIELWKAHRCVPDAEKSEVYGMPADVIGYLRESGLSDADSWEPYLLAARATTGLSTEQVRMVMDCLREGGLAPSRSFASVKKEVRKAFVECAEPVAHEIGYAAARRFREALSESGALWPERICAALGIPLLFRELPRNIDGIAFATASRCGVLINTQGLHSASSQGRKFTILHELGHLLLEFNDFQRGNFEIKTGSSGSFFEKICNAFAAEALVPRSELREFASRPGVSLADLLRMAHQRFEVGDTVTTYQICNDEELFMSLDPRDRIEIERRKAQPAKGL